MQRSHPPIQKLMEINLAFLYEPKFLVKYFCMCWAIMIKRHLQQHSLFVTRI